MALAVLIWDKTANQGSLTGPTSVQATPDSFSSHAGPDNPQNKGITPALGTSSQNPPVPHKNLPLPDQTVSEPGNRKILQKLIDKMNGLSTPSDKQTVTRDLFVASDKFKEALGPDPTDNDQQKQSEYVLSLQLSGILISSNLSCALIDEQVVFPGDNIGPFLLKHIAFELVVLEAEGKLITLYLDQ